MKKLMFAAVLIVAATVAATNAFSQPRPLDTGKPAAKAKPAPQAFDAKYEGGMIGFSEKLAGQLRFDDANSRLVFFDSDSKEKFSIPYASMLAIYPQSQSVTSPTGNVVKYIPLPGAGLAGFIKEKRRYLIVQYDDPDVDVHGLANFRIEDKDLLDSVLQTLADKAKLSQRGDAYYRPRTAKSDN